MKVNLDLTAVAAENYIEDAYYFDVGSPSFILRHDYFYGEEKLEIWTAVGQTGTQLSGSDYSLGGLDENLTERAERNVYTNLQITNVTYQTGDLYFTYQACADFVDADDRYQVYRTDDQYWKLNFAGGFDLYTSDTSTDSVLINSSGGFNLDALSSISMSSDDGFSIQDDSGAEIIVTSAGATSIKSLSGQDAFFGDTTGTSGLTVGSGKITIDASDISIDSIIIGTPGGIDIDSATGINIQDKFLGTGNGGGITLITDVDNASGTSGDINLITTIVTGTSGDIVVNSAGDLTLNDQYLTSAIPLSESGETGLSGFTATSLIGGLNEVKTEAVPSGGTTDQVLTKDSATDNDTSWQDIPYPDGYIFGVETSAATDVEHDITIEVGKARSYSNTYNLNLTSALTKRIDTTWAVGNNNGGLFSGTVAADTTYHCFLIRKDTDGSIDAGWDTSISCSNIPTGYTTFRRIRSYLTDSSSNILGTSQNNDEFRLKTCIRDVLNTDIVSTPANYVLSVPSGINVLAMAEARGAEVTGTMYWYSPEDDDQTIGAGYTESPASTRNEAATWTSLIRTNTSSQIRGAYYGSPASHCMYTRGWIDDRGQYGGY